MLEEEAEEYFEVIASTVDCDENDADEIKF